MLSIGSYSENPWFVVECIFRFNFIFFYHCIMNWSYEQVRQWCTSVIKDDIILSRLKNSLVFDGKRVFFSVWMQPPIRLFKYSSSFVLETDASRPIATNLGLLLFRWIIFFYFSSNAVGMCVYMKGKNWNTYIDCNSICSRLFLAFCYIFPS